MEDFIRGIPKCELHMHLGGNIEPEMAFKLAQRNGLKLKYGSPEELAHAYNFKDLGGFIELFVEGIKVVKTEQDLYEIAMDYLRHCHEENVTHCEIQHAPEMYDIPFEDAMKSVVRAMAEAEEKWGIKSKLILCCERHKPEQVGFDSLEQIRPWMEHFVGVGLASAEIPFPPRMFVKLFDKVKQTTDLKIVIHAGEEGPPEYVEEALDLLHAERIDHGNRAQENPELLKRIRDQKVPLAMCPLSNLKLKVINDLKEHPLKKFMDMGIMVTVNSDDPAFFRGYMNANLIEIQKALNLSRDDIVQICKNGFLASWFPESEKQKGIAAIDEYVKNFDKK